MVDRLGGDWLIRATRVSGEEPLVALHKDGRPRLVVSWHAGVGAGLPAGLARLGQTGLLLREDGRPERFGLSHVRIGGGLANRAAAFQRAVRHLRGGGLVALYLDVDPWAPGAEPPHAFLGRQVALPPGPAAMARLSGAAIIPVTPRWDAGRVSFACHPPLAGAAGAAGDDRSVTAALAAWWERWLRRHPGDLWPTSVRRLLAAPTVDVTARRR